ncbi:iron-regulated protein, partial [Proteus mirabilis]|uniref:ChaN family lipoprotein n=1 Tax=Proteus mirabilis TaxID=584 RepID=UPI00258126F3|nr:iron-regulated protein [Proteus mirabilis]
NQYHHEIEYWLMTQLNNKSPQGAVLLEMLKPDQQNLVDNTKKRYSRSQYLRDERLMSVLNLNKCLYWTGYGNLIKEGL